MKTTATFLASILTSFILSVTVIQKTHAAPAPEKKEAAKVLLNTVDKTTDTYKVLVPAKVEAKIQSTLTAEVDGHVIRILKPLGSAVRANEAILVVENKDPGFTYAQVSVRSPVNGVITQMLVSQMSKINRGDKLLTITDPRSVKMNVEFSSQDAPFITQGLKGNLKVGVNEMPVQVTGISPWIDPRTGTASAVLEFSQKPTQMPLLGTIGQATFSIARGEIILLPENAIGYRDGKPMLKILKADNTIEKRNIELGEQRDNLFIIKSGLKTGEKVVVRASRAIKDGEAVEIEKSDEKKTQ